MSKNKSYSTISRLVPLSKSYYPYSDDYLDKYRFCKHNNNRVCDLCAFRRDDPCNLNCKCDSFDKINLLIIHDNKCWVTKCVKNVYQYIIDEEIKKDLSKNKELCNEIYNLDIYSQVSIQRLIDYVSRLQCFYLLKPYEIDKIINHGYNGFLIPDHPI